jgi:hypothetical protein
MLPLGDVPFETFYSRLTSLLVIFLSIQLSASFISFLVLRRMIQSVCTRTRYLNTYQFITFGPFSGHPFERRRALLFGVLTGFGQLRMPLAIGSE